MATLKTDTETIEVKDDSSILDPCESLGVPFGCHDGQCGTCEITILAGMEHLNEQTDNEKHMKLPKGHRLACQCTISSGEVHIKM